VPATPPQRSGEFRLEVLAEETNELVGLIFLYEMAARGQDLEPSAWYAVRQFATPLHGDPGVVLAPDHEVSSVMSALLRFSVTVCDTFFAYGIRVTA
jgi:hypothetical protein